MRAAWAVLHQDRIVTECDGQDVGDRVEGGQPLFPEEIDRTETRSQLRERRGGMNDDGDTDGLGFLSAAPMMRELCLHRKKVSLSRNWVLHDPQPDMLVAKTLVAPFPLRIIPGVFIVCGIVVISIVCVLPRLGPVVVWVLWVLL